MTLSRRHLRTAGLALVSVGGLLGVLYYFDPSSIAASLVDLRLPAIALAAALLVANTLFSLWRFKSTLRSFGYRPNWRDVFFAFSVGQISNQVLLNVVGQSLSRATALTSSGVPFAVSVMATYWERLVAAGLLFVLSVASALYLFVHIGIDLQTGGAYLISLVGAMTLTAFAVIWLVVHKTEFELSLAAAMRQALKLWPSVVLTLAAHASMLLAYIVILHGLALPTISADLIAALTIVMFSASLPISFSGWGIRELSAAKALGTVGVDPATAVAAAVAIGLLSLGVLLVSGAIGVALLARRKKIAAASIETGSASGGVNRWSGVMIAGSAILCAVLLFFQIRLPVEHGEVTANAGDILALTGLGFLLFFMWSRRSTAPLPNWMFVALTALSALFILSLAIGYLRFGSNHWALINRGFGWVIIVGYVAVGAAIALVPQQWGRRLLLSAFAVAGATIAAIQLALLILSLFGLSLPEQAFVVPLRGYANNSNAFAFQMVMTAICALTANRIGAFGERPVVVNGILAVVTLAVYYSHSRSGLGMLLMLLVLMSVFDRRENGNLLLGNCIAVIGALGVAFALPYGLPYIISFVNAVSAALDRELPAIDPPALSGLIRVAIERTSSDNERWLSIIYGWDLWLQNPFIGNGLGAFVQSRLEQNLPFLVIHSIPIWLLAEMGLLGLTVTGIILAKFTHSAFQMMAIPEEHGWGMGLLIMLACMTTSGLVHDLFFQRTFWFLLGLFLAVPNGTHSFAANEPSSAASNRLGNHHTALS